MNQVDREKLEKRMNEIDCSKGESRKLLQTKDSVTTEQFLDLLEYTFYELFPNKALVMEDWNDFHVTIPMLRAAICKNWIEECKKLVPRLLKHHWINWEDDEGNTFLHLAVINNADIEICKLLIDNMHAIPINVQNDNKLTAYQEAKNRGYTNICELLEDKILEGGKK